MDEITIKQIVEEDGRVVLTDLPVQRGDTIEVTVRMRQPARRAKKMTIAELLASDLVGMWADRADIGDSVEFARRLRKEAETRDWSDDDPSGH